MNFVEVHFRIQLYRVPGYGTIFFPKKWYRDTILVLPVVERTAVPDDFMVVPNASTLVGEYHIFSIRIPEVVLECSVH